MKIFFNRIITCFILTLNLTEVTVADDSDDEFAYEEVCTVAVCHMLPETAKLFSKYLVDI